MGMTGWKPIPLLQDESHLRIPKVLLISLMENTTYGVNLEGDGAPDFATSPESFD
jgi:hypothetical protein